MNFLLRLVTWWNGQTLGTQLFTFRRGQKVGEDTQGNRYFQTRDGKRRWVIYNGETEASRIAPDWHGWLHFAGRTADRGAAEAQAQDPHQENLTGTPLAYVPPGSILLAAPQVRADYEAWSPE
ncbi:MAG: NADH:ubiquinone oxidoreductase subunit NDUFA12 [Paracoccaceae bacterium]